MNLYKKHQPDRITHLLLLTLLIVMGLIVLVQSNPGTRLPGRDYGFYAYIGDQILHGRLPYRDAWESKPPAIFYLNSLALVLGRGTRWGIWLVEWVSLLGSGIFSYINIKKLWGIFPAVGSLLLWLIGLNLTLQGGNLTEEFPLILHFLSLTLFLSLVEQPQRSLQMFLLGVAFGISFLFRPNNAVVEAAIIITVFLLLIVRRNWKILFHQALWLGLGIVLPVLATGLYFWSQGLFQELLEASILYNLTYSKTAITSTSPLLAGFKIFGLLAWVSTAGYFLSIYYALKTKQPIYLLLLIGTPLTVYVSDLAQRNYDHYFMNWLPFLALLCGLTIYFMVSSIPIVRGDPLQWERTALGAMIFLAMGYFFISGIAGEYEKALQRMVRHDEMGVEIRTRTASYVENHTDPGDLVLFWAASPGENFMSNRETPSAYLFYPLYVHSEISQRMNEQFLKDIQSKRPALIVDIGDHEALSLAPEERAQQITDGFAWEYPPENLNEFFQFVEENYYLDAKVGDKTVYRLRQP